MSHETRTKPPTYPEILEIHDGAFSESIWGSDGFRTIKVTGQDDVIADSYKDNLTIAAGTNVTLTTSASGDSLTIASTPYTAGTGIELSGNEFSITALAITSVHSVANETAHLALTTQEGDIVVRTDENKSYIRNTGTANNMSDFTLLQTPTDLVLSVAGNVGHVTNNQIRDAVEAATDSNTFTDADHTKLNAIEASATADQTSTEIKSLLAGDNITGTHISDEAIDSEHYVDGSIDHVHLSGDCVDGDNIDDDSINSEHYVDGSIDTAHIADDQVTYAKMQNVSATDRILGRDSSGAGVVEEITPANLRTMINVEDGADVTDATNVDAAGAVMNADVDAKGDILAASTDNTVTRLAVGTDNHILTADSNETTGLKWRAENAHTDKVNQDAFSIVAVSGQDNVVADAAQDTLTFAAGTNVTLTTNASSDTVTIAAADTSKMPLAGGTFTGDVTINDGEELGFGSQNDLVIVHDGTDGLIKETTGNLDIQAKNTNGGLVTISDSAGTNLIKATAGSSVVLTYDGTPKVTTTDAGVTIAGTLTANLDINTSTITDLQTTITDSDSNIPTSGAVVDYVADIVGPIGGLEVIADDESFPDTVPAAGVVISITDCAGLSVNSSGVSTNGDTLNNSIVTINNFPNELKGGATVGSQTNANPYVFGAGAGLMVQSTGSNHTYNYHQALIRESDFVRLSSDLDDFQERYRVASSAPSSDNHDGDLYYDTSVNKMKVYNGTTSAWDDVSSSAESHIVTLSQAFDDSRKDFTMSTAATDAQSTIVSINGVIQKPNAGTSTPTEGFAISGNTLKLAAAPATGSDFFCVVLGDTVAIGTPSDNTVNGDKIVEDAVGYEHIEVLDGNLQFADNAKAQFGTTDNDLAIYHDSNHSYINHSGTGNFYIYGNGINDLVLRADSAKESIKCVHDEQVEIYYNDGIRLETIDKGIQVKGNPIHNTFVDIIAGDGKNAAINLWADEGADNGDKWQIDSETDGYFRIYNNAEGSWEKSLAMKGNQGIILYYNDSAKFETTDNGVDVTNAGDARFYVKDTSNSETWGIRAYSGNTEVGTHTAHDWGIHRNNSQIAKVMDGKIRFSDSKKATFGGADELQVYHDGSTSYIKNTSNDAGNLIMSANGTGCHVYIQGKDGADSIIAEREGAVKLYYDGGSPAFETTEDGAKVTGELAVTGDVGIGDTSPESILDVEKTNDTTYPFTTEQSGTYAYQPYDHEINIKNLKKGTANSFTGIHFHAGEHATNGYNSTARISAVNTGDYKADLVFGTRNTNFGERLRIKADGNIKTPNGVQSSGNASGGFEFDSVETACNLGIQQPSSAADTNAAFQVWDGASNNLRINYNGSIGVGCNPDGNVTTVGSQIGNSWGIFTRASSTPLYVHRETSDGTLIAFYGQNNSEGNITISDTTVSLTGAHLSRWSQIKGLSTTDKSARPTIYQGTVMSNLDDLCVWNHAEVLYKEGDEIPEGKAVGDVKKAAYTENNQQLNMTKVSDTVGDKDVAGVFWIWDDDDDEIVNDFYIAMTGDMVIRVAGSTTVARGDLLESAGDGTAKPQSDDILRSKTIAKIISTNSTATYPDGSKAYPCVLMAC